MPKIVTFLATKLSYGINFFLELNILNITLQNLLNNVTAYGKIIVWTPLFTHLTHYNILLVGINWYIDSI